MSPLATCAALFAATLPLERSLQSAEASLALSELASPAGQKTGMPSLTLGADGRTYLTWLERSEERRGSLFFAVLEKEGWSAAHPIASGDDWFLNWADFPALGALEDGTLVASWLARNGDNTYSYGIRFVLSHDAGGSWSKARWLHTDSSPTEHGFVSFAALDDGFGAIWLDGRETLGKPHGEGATGLYFRTIARDGTLGPERLLDGRVCDCCQTAMIAEGGKPLVAYRDRSREEHRDISLKRIDPATEPAGAVDVDLAKDGWRITGCPVNGPRLASDGKQTAAVWYTAARTPAEVLVSISAEGRAFGRPLPVDEGAPEGRVDAVFLGDGSLLVGWLEHLEDGAAWRLRRLRAPDFVPESPVTLARVSSDRASGFLRLVATHAGAMAAWTDLTDGRRVRTARITVVP